MKSKTIKTTAAVLSTAILLGIGATAVSAEKTDIKKSETGVSAAETSVTETKDEKTPVIVSSKDETVYVLSEADGAPREIIVSDWLRNNDGAASIKDKSDLKDIENVKGHEEYTDGGDGRITWNTDGEDIYYQGTSSKELPVDLKVTYTLDGKEISPKELAGKSGKLKMRFDYNNKCSKVVPINGKPQKINIPFIMLTGTMLDTDVFRNVQVVNGRLENLGNAAAVMGIAFPGMQENLNIDTKDLEIPDYIEITADVKNFDMGPTLTVATTAPFEDIDTEDLSADDIKDQIKKLTDGVTQLMDGSGQLYDGLNTLLEQSGVLADGVDQLSAGAVNLQAGADALNGGASQLLSGASALSEGLDTLDSNSSALTDGAYQVFTTLLSTAETQLTAAGVPVSGLTVDNYADVLDGVINSLDSNAVYETVLEKVTEGVNAKRGEIQEQVTAAVKEQVSLKVKEEVTAAVRAEVENKVKENEDTFRAAVILQATSKTPEEYQAAIEAGLISQEIQDAVEAGVEAAMAAEVENQMGSEDVKQNIESISASKTEEQMATDEINGLISTNTDMQVEKAISDTMASPEIQAQLEAASEGAEAVIALKSSLDSYNGFYLGVLTYTSGVSAAASGAEDLAGGADTLKNGMDDLTSGVDQLSSGIGTLKDKTPDLIEGVTALRDGSGSLKDGITKMMDEGIQKIADLAEGDLSDLTERITASIDAGKGYKTYSGMHDDSDGAVKFIYKTDSITNEKEK